jgi:hypothetical protein
MAAAGIFYAALKSARGTEATLHLPMICHGRIYSGHSRLAYLTRRSRGKPERA